MVTSTPMELPSIWSVLKLTPGRPLQVCCLSELVGLRVHFERSSLICPREGCPACQQMRQSKYVGYCAVWDSQQIVLLRLTEPAARLAVNAGVIFPGSVVQLEKRAAKATAFITECKPVDLPQKRWITKEQLLRRLALLHGLGWIPDSISGAGFDEEIERRARKVLERGLIN